MADRCRPALLPVKGKACHAGLIPDAESGDNAHLGIIAIPPGNQGRVNGLMFPASFGPCQRHTRYRFKTAERYSGSVEACLIRVSTRIDDAVTNIHGCPL